MLFSITGDVAPPPDLTSPNKDIDGAMYVWKKGKKESTTEQQTKILRLKVKTPYMVILEVHIQEQTLKWLG